MKIIKGKATYRLPHYYEIHDVNLKFKKVAYKLQHRFTDYGLPTLTKSRPTSFSLGDKNKIEFYPIPDRNYTVDVTFTVMKKM